MTLTMFENLRSSLCGHVKADGVGRAIRVNDLAQEAHWLFRRTGFIMLLSK